MLEAIDEVTLYKRAKFINRGGLIGLGGEIVSGAAIAGSDNDSEGDSTFIMLEAIVGLVAGSRVGAVASSPETIYIPKDAAMKKAEQ